jgi:hypothetical protein
MYEINSMLEELMEYSKEYNMDEISKEELNLKLDLLISRIEKVEINFTEQPMDTLPEYVKGSFNALLFQSKYKAIESIKTLKDAKEKRSVNARLRKVLGNKLYFRSLYSVMWKNINGYVNRNGLQHWNPNMQIFIIQGGNENGK